MWPKQTARGPAIVACVDSKRDTSQDCGKGVRRELSMLALTEYLPPQFTKWLICSEWYPTFV